MRTDGSVEGQQDEAQQAPSENEAEIVADGSEDDVSGVALAALAPVVLVGLADNVGHAVIAGTYQNNRVIFFHEKQMRSCLRHLSCCFCRQRVKLDVLRHYVANCFGRIR